MFDEMPERNLATWNAYISNAVIGGRPRNAIDAFIKLRQAGGEEPNSITFCAFLNACSNCSLLDLGRQLHGFVVRSGFDGNVSVCNGFVDFYGKCKEVGFAKMVFDGIEDKNDVSWYSMLSVYVQNYEEEKACQRFRGARSEGVEPKDFMVSIVVSACAGIAGLELGRSVHAVAVKAYVETNVFVRSALVDMYGKCGSIEDAETAFNEMPDRNLVCWNAMIGGYARQGHADMTLALFEDSGNHILLSNMFAAAGRWEDADLVRKEMKVVGIKKGAGCSWISVKHRFHVFQAKDTSNERNSC